jgi:mannitol operon repressor
MKEEPNNPFGVDPQQWALQKKCNSLESILSSETDRGAAILGAAYIEERLYEMTLKYLRESKVTRDFVRRQSLDSITSLAFALGLINKHEYEGINQIRIIRNQFAHSFLENLSFDDSEIALKCENLLYDDHFWVSGNKVETNREKFICSVFILGRSLLFRVGVEDRLDLLYE